jgi:hypothetical protein
VSSTFLVFMATRLNATIHHLNTIHSYNVKNILYGCQCRSMGLLLKRVRLFLEQPKLTAKSMFRIHLESLISIDVESKGSEIIIQFS